MKLLATAATSLTMLAAGFALGVATVPSPTLEHRIAEAEIARCTEWLAITLAIGNAATHRLIEHLNDEIGPLPDIDELRDDVAKLRATIAAGTEGGRP